MSEGVVNALGVWCWHSSLAARFAFTSRCIIPGTFTRELARQVSSSVSPGWLCGVSMAVMVAKGLHRIFVTPTRLEGTFQFHTSVEVGLSLLSRLGVLQLHFEKRSFSLRRLGFVSTLVSVAVKS